MQEDGKPINSQRTNYQWTKVRFGNTVLRARRMSTGAWWIEDERGYHVETVTNDKFLAQYDPLPKDYQ